jgi:hypothetical protein
LPKKRGKAKNFQKGEKHKMVVEVRESEEAQEGNAKCLRAAASRASSKDY